MGRENQMLLKKGIRLLFLIRTYAKKPGLYSKSLFLTHKYLGETGFLSLPA